MLSSLEGVNAPVTEKFLAYCVKECQQELAAYPKYEADDVVNDVVMDGLSTLDGHQLLRMANELGLTTRELAATLRDVDGDYVSAFIVACSEFCIPEVLRRFEQDASAEEEASFHEQVLAGNARRRLGRR